MKVGTALRDEMEKHNRTIEVRLTADDLPTRDTRVTLDRRHVDEFGIPVARISRQLGMNEWMLTQRAIPELEAIFGRYASELADFQVSPARVDLVGDHQMGTCRMGTDPKASVLNPNCRVWDAENVFVVDSSFMPTGLGLNPMETVVANALRVGAKLVKDLRNGTKLGEP